MRSKIERIFTRFLPAGLLSSVLLSHVTQGETEPARRLGLLCTIKSVAQQNKVAIKGVAVITTQHGFLKRANI